MEVYFKRRLVLSEEISVLRMSVKIYNQAMQENTLDTFTISDWRNKRFIGKLDKQMFLFQKRIRSMFLSPADREEGREQEKTIMVGMHMHEPRN